MSVAGSTGGATSPGSQTDIESWDIEKLEIQLELLQQKNELLAVENEMYSRYLQRQSGLSGAVLGTLSPSVGGSAVDETSSDVSDSSYGSAAERKRRGRGRKREGKDTQKSELPLDNKLEIAQREVEEWQGEIDKEKTKYERMIEDLRAKMEEIDTHIRDVHKDAFEFRRDIVLNSENPRTGKIMSEKVIRFFEEKLKQKQAMIEKLRLKNTALKSHVAKLDSTLKQREEMGEALHMIDFDQLKIENQQYLEKIEERNNDLLNLKLTTGNTVQLLNAHKEKLNKLMAESSWLKKEIMSRSDTLRKLKNEIDSITEQKDVEGQTQKKLIIQQEELKVPEVEEYVNQKAELYELEKAVKNWERKVEIAEGQLKLARTKVRKM